MIKIVAKNQRRYTQLLQVYELEIKIKFKNMTIRIYPHFNNHTNQIVFQIKSPIQIVFYTYTNKTFQYKSPHNISLFINLHIKKKITLIEINEEHLSKLKIC